MTPPVTSCGIVEVVGLNSSAPRTRANPSKNVNITDFAAYIRRSPILFLSNRLSGLPVAAKLSVFSPTLSYRR